MMNRVFLITLYCFALINIYRWINLETVFLEITEDLISLSKNENYFPIWS